MASRKSPIAKGMPKHYANERYRLACAEPYLWMQKAEEIRSAADMLWVHFCSEIKTFSDGSESQEPRHGAVAIMLYGLAIENLLKAGLAYKDKAAGSNGNFGQKTHDLQGLAVDFGLEISSDEYELLERLQHFVEWAGRYPIPLYRDGLYPRDLLDGSKSVLYGYSTRDGELISEMLRKIKSSLPKEEDALLSYVRNVS